MASYSIWLLEYARIPQGMQAGQANADIRLMPFSYIVLKGEGHVAMIDVGMDPNQDDYTKQIVQKDDVRDWQPPEQILAKIGVKPSDVDTVFMTHAHYDHMGNLMAFPNAQFYIQKCEYQSWLWALSLPPRYQTVLAAVNPQDLKNAKTLVDSGRMILIDGAQENVLPGIHLRPAYDSHTYGSQMVIVEDQDDPVPWVYCGDLAYVRTSLTGIDGNGIYNPIDFLVGTKYNVMKAYDEIIEMVGENLHHVIIGHETNSWQIYPAWQTEDQLHVAEIHLAPGGSTRKPG